MAMRTTLVASKPEIDLDDIDINAVKAFSSELRDHPLEFVHEDLPPNSDLTILKSIFSNEIPQLNLKTISTGKKSEPIILSDPLLSLLSILPGSSGNLKSMGYSQETGVCLDLSIGLRVDIAIALAISFGAVKHIVPSRRGWYNLKKVLVCTFSSAISSLVEP